MKMNSPYMGKFRVTQAYKGDSVHDGLDLVGIDSKEIHATVSGTVHYAGWENSADHSQGFGQYVCIKGADGRYYYYGHLSEIKVKSGQSVKVTDVVGIEGSTGRSTGSHCHYCIRPNFCKGSSFNVSEISGIPNSEGGIYDDGYRTGTTASAKRTKSVTLTIDGVTYEGTITEK